MAAALWISLLVTQLTPEVALVEPTAALRNGALLTDEGVQGRVQRALEAALRARVGDLVVIAPRRAEALPPPPATLSAPIVALKERAEAAAREAEYGEAVRLYGELVDAIEQSLGEIGSITPLLEARLELARLFQGTGEPRLMSDELLRVARAAPTLELDLRRFPPPLVEGLAAAQARLDEEAQAAINLAISPAGTQVFVDGVSRCEAPCELALPAGPHLLWLTRPGHQPVMRALQLAAGSRVIVEAALDPTPLHAVSSALVEEMQGNARTESGRLLAQGVLRENGARAVLLAGVLPLDGGYVISVRRFGENEGLVYGLLDTELTELESLCTSLVEASLSGASGPLERASLPGVTGSPPSAFDPDQSLFGFEGREEQRNAEAEGPPWMWVSIGGAALVATLGASAVGAWALLAPAEQRQAPDTVRIDIEVAP